MDYLPRFKFNLKKVDPDEFDVNTVPVGQEGNKPVYSPEKPLPNVKMSFAFDYGSSELIDALTDVREAYVHGSAFFSAAKRVIGRISKNFL